MRAKGLTVQELYSWAVKNGYEEYPIGVITYGEVDRTLVSTGSNIVSLEQSTVWVDELGNKSNAVILIGNAASVLVDDSIDWLQVSEYAS